MNIKSNGKSRLEFVRFIAIAVTLSAGDVQAQPTPTITTTIQSGYSGRSEASLTLPIRTYGLKRRIPTCSRDGFRIQTRYKMTCIAKFFSVRAVVTFMAWLVQFDDGLKRITSIFKDSQTWSPDLIEGAPASRA